MMSGQIKKGLSADLGEKLIKVTPMPVPKLPVARIKQPLRKQIKAPKTPSPEGTQMGRDLDHKKLVSISEAKPFTPSKRDMELKDAHLGTPPQQSANPAKLTRTKAGGPVKPKRQKAKRKKRTIKLKA